jgi:hypothetical protein
MPATLERGASPATSQPSSSTPASSGPGHGTITIRELSPSPGATLTVRACPSGAVTRLCADQWRSTIDVQVDREMTYAVLVVLFYDGATLCGLSANTLDVLPPDRLVTFDLSSIWLSGGGLATPCQLPMRTTRIEVVLWSDSSSWTNTLMMGFPGTYTFVSQ